MSLLNVKNLINSLRGTDPKISEILTQIVDEIDANKSSDSSSSDWGPLTQITNHVATDFTASGGEVWNVIGVATLIGRSFKVTKDKTFMYYDVEIYNSTIVTGGIGAVLSVALPAGYAGAGNFGGQAFTGAGHAVAIPAAGIAFEPSAVYAVDGLKTISIIRPQGAFYPASVANFSLRFSIFTGVRYQGASKS